MSVAPYLTGEVREAFDAWLEATRARYLPPLTLTEVRKGVRALSSLWVERRDAGDVASRSVSGQGKRAAFASFYAPLHFLTAYHAVREALSEAAAGAEVALAAVRRVHDLGCGTGASGAAAAVALGGGAGIHACDRSGWALGEARRTYAAFALRARTRRAALPAAVPRRVGPEDLLVAGWVLNELGEGPRGASLAALDAALARGAHLLVLEPLAGPAAPWWAAWARSLPARLRRHTLKRRAARPAWIAQLDKAAGLDHGVLGARVVLG